MDHLFKMLLQMTFHVSSCCRFLSWHICREFSSANFFFSISSQENSFIKVTHCQNILFILFIQCFAERETQVWYQRCPRSAGKTPKQHRVSFMLWTAVLLPPPWATCPSSSLPALGPKTSPGSLQGSLVHQHLDLSKKREKTTLLSHQLWINQSGSAQLVRG